MLIRNTLIILVLAIYIIWYLVLEDYKKKDGDKKNYLRISFWSTTIISAICIAILIFSKSEGEEIIFISILILPSAYNFLFKNTIDFIEANKTLVKIKEQLK